MVSIEASCPAFLLSIDVGVDVGLGVSTLKRISQHLLLLHWRNRIISDVQQALDTRCRARMHWDLKNSSQSRRAHAIIRHQPEQLVRRMGQWLDCIGIVKVELHFNQKLTKIEREQDLKPPSTHDRVTAHNRIVLVKHDDAQPSLNTLLACEAVNPNKHTIQLIC